MADFVIKNVFFFSLGAENLNIPEKILRYEEFVNDVLKERLKVIHSTAERILNDLSEYIQLKNTIETIMEMDCLQEKFKTQVDIGCNFYMTGQVTDPSKIFVNVGLNHYVEFTLAEAVKVIEKRISLLKEQLKKLREHSADTKAHIKLVLNGIEELAKLQ